MSNAGYKIHTYIPTTFTQYSAPIILASAVNRSESFAEDCARCRVRSRIKYTVAKHGQTNTIHWDKVVCPDEFANQAYTDILPLTH